MLRQKDRGKKGKFIIYYKKKTKVWAQRASITLGDKVEPTEIDLGTTHNALSYSQTHIFTDNNLSNVVNFIYPPFS